MTEIIVRIGHALMLIGFFGAIGIQVVIFIRIAKFDAVKALMTLIIPGYVLYYVWRFDNKMLRLIKIWILGVILFVLGILIFSIAS